MVKVISCYAIILLTLLMMSTPYANANSLFFNFEKAENLIAAKADQNFLVKMQGIRNGKQESKSANIWATSQEEAISKAIKIWEQNSFQNIKIVEVKKLN